MAKIITTVGACSTRKKPIGLQFVAEGSECALSGSFSVGAKIVVSAEGLTGTPVVGAAYARTGCKYCGNKHVYQCGACKKFVCYDGTAQKNHECPLCGSRADVPACNDSRIPRTVSIDSPYTKWASTSDIPAPKRDRHGNPQGSEYDLARDGSLKQYTVIVLNILNPVRFGRKYSFDCPYNALKKKGFKLIEFTKIPTDNELRNALATPNSQLWIISSAGDVGKLNDAQFRMIVQYFEEGHGVYFWNDNDPLFADCNPFLEKLFGTRMVGDYYATKILTIQKRPNEPGIIANHPISTGIVNFYEGITISHVQTLSGGLQPLIYASDRTVVTAIYDKNGRRAIVDGGFTRLYEEYWVLAGTERFIVNSAAWLANIERFGYRQ